MPRAGRPAEEQIPVRRETPAGCALPEHDDRLTAAEPGDHVRFPADRPHRYRAGPDEPLEAVNVIITPA